MVLYSIAFILIGIYLVLVNLELFSWIFFVLSIGFIIAGVKDEQQKR